jgi:hypothetical protein
MWQEICHSLRRRQELQSRNYTKLNVDRPREEKKKGLPPKKTGGKKSQRYPRITSPSLWLPQKAETKGRPEAN